MALSSGYGGCCPSCGSTGGCSCGYQSGYDYSSCSPDYNPVTVNNSTCPNVEGSTGGAGGAASGNNSSINVSLGPQVAGGKDDCCCKNGVNKLMEFLYKQSLETVEPTTTLCIYGNIIPDGIMEDNCVGSLFDLTTTNEIQVASITNDTIKASTKAVTSLCAATVIKFKFQGNVNKDAAIRKEFFYTPKCTCCCDCGDGVGRGLYYACLGTTFTSVLLDETVKESLVANKIVQGQLETVELVAVDSHIAIFSNQVASGVYVYYGVPTCKIANFI